MAEQASLDQFVAVTGESEATARFYLGSAKGDINVRFCTVDDKRLTSKAAIFAYLDSQGGQSTEQAAMPGSYQEQQQEPRAAKSSKGKAKASNRGGIGTLGGLNQDDSDDDAEKPAEFYTGGEKSGLGVLDPSKKKVEAKGPNSLIQEILRKAAGAGRSTEEPEPQSSNFQGSGYTLGGEDEESRKIEDPNEVFRQSMAHQPPKVTRVLKLWKDGFSVGDGPLYRYDDPANKRYLDAINNGTAPVALLDIQYGQSVDVDVEKCLDQNYQPPPKVYKPFEGSGQRLGSEIPPSTSSTQAVPQAIEPSTKEPAPTMTVDESKPITSLQLRLASGQRVVSRFNTSHTLADVYSFIERTHPSEGRTFILLTPFPRKEYPNDSTTLESAGLLKGMLQQKFT